MNLLCPSCQKMLQVPDQYAGQQMRCPMCNNVFSVPALPPGGAPALGSVPVPPPMDMGAPPPMPGGPPPMMESPRRAPAAPVPMRDYTKQCGITFNPRVVSIVNASLLLAALLFTFLPWLPSMNAWDIAFSSFNKQIMLGLWAIFVIPAFLWALFSMLAELGAIPLPPSFMKIRALIGIGIVGLAFLFFLIQRMMGLFDFKNLFPLNFSGLICFWCTFWAVILTLLEMWQQMRGPGSPPLKLQMHS